MKSDDNTSGWQFLIILYQSTAVESIVKKIELNNKMYRQCQVQFLGHSYCNKSYPPQTEDETKNDPKICITIIIKQFRDRSTMQGHEFNIVL